MSITVQVKVDTGAARGVFNAIRTAFVPPMAPPMRLAFQRVADKYDAYIASRFDRISSTGGVGEWAQLRPRTVAEKKRKGQTGGILVATRRMRASLDPAHPEHVRQALPNGIRTGSRERKLRFHQDGAPSRHLPQREVIVPPHPQLVRELTAEMARGMREVIAAARAAAPRVPQPSLN